MKTLLVFFVCCSAAYATNGDLSLDINSSPDSAQVYVNYQMKGTTPLSLSSVPQRNFALTLEKGKYEPFHMQFSEPEGKYLLEIDLIKPATARDIEKNTKHFRLTKRIVSGINFALTIGGVLFSRRASIEFEDYEKALFFNSNPSTYVESNVDRSNVLIISGATTSLIPFTLNFFPLSHNNPYTGNHAYYFDKKHVQSRQTDCFISAAVHLISALVLNAELNIIEEDEKSALWKSDFSGINRKKSFRAASNVMFALGAVDLLHVLYLHLRKPEVKDYIELEPY